MIVLHSFMQLKTASKLPIRNQFSMQNRLVVRQTHISVVSSYTNVLWNELIKLNSGCSTEESTSFTLRWNAITEPEENETVYDVTMKQLDSQFAHKVYSAYKRHLFRAMKQLSDDTIDQDSDRKQTFMNLETDRRRIFEIKK